jgi:hypothetical protein
MNIIQAKFLIIGLEFEIKTDGRMQMTRESSMHALGRLLGIDAYKTFGRGIKGRQKAVEWLKEQVAELAPELADLDD